MDYVFFCLNYDCNDLLIDYDFFVLNHSVHLINLIIVQDILQNFFITRLNSKLLAPKLTNNPIPKPNASR